MSRDLGATRMPREVDRLRPAGLPPVDGDSIRTIQPEHQAREAGMAQSDGREDDRSVALYWDFENLHASLHDERFGEGSYAKQDNRFKAQEPLVDVQAIVELASSFGPIAINRAYCNWQFYGRYRDALLQGAVELIQLFPPGGSAKNGADIKLCLDAVEDLGRFAHIGTVVIIGGDSDYMPAAPAPERDPAAELLRRAIKLLAETKGDPWVNKGSIWHMIKRLDPTFDPKEHGYANFQAMVKALDSVLEVKKGESDQIVRLKQPGGRQDAAG
jgi:hypothetical protein